MRRAARAMAICSSAGASCRLSFLPLLPDERTCGDVTVS
jgi:hypothetical protein